MARSFNRRRRESRKRFWSALFKVFVVLAFIGSIGFYAYVFGMNLASREIDGLKAEIAELTGSEKEARDQVLTLKGALAASEQRADQFRAQYEEVAPEEMRAIIAQAQGRIAEGIPPERLSFIIAQAQLPRNCTEADTRRFIARTQNYDGPNTSIRFNETITVSGQGTAANGGREQWFDATQPVTVTFEVLGGKTTEISGILPLQHALIFKDKEYRFTASVGQRGFIEVTADWCDYNQ